VAKRAKKSRKSPAHQAKDASPVNGVIPPPEHRWQPGQSGNPEGRPAAGAAVKEWWNEMADWTQAEVKAALDDPTSSLAKKAAARAWLDACSADRSSSGAPIAGTDLDRIIDHTAGKPTQHHDHTTAGQPFQLIDRPTWDKV
jgi:hypothetical protein